MCIYVMCSPIRLLANNLMAILEGKIAAFHDMRALFSFSIHIVVFWNIL